MRIIGRMLDFSGRTGVADYWRLQRPLILIQAVGFVICMGFLMSSGPRALAVLGLPLIVLALAANLVLVIRRLHDRGRSGWWMLLFQGAPLLMSLLVQTAGRDIYETAPAASWALLALALASLGLAVWGFVEIGLRRGQPGENRFGPSVI